MFKIISTIALIAISFFSESQFMTDTVIVHGHSSSNSVLNVDLDQDGLKDVIVLAQDHGSIYFYKNIGNSQFADKIAIVDFGRWFNGECLNFQDFDQDGDLDFCYYNVGATEDFVFYRNDGGLNFTNLNMTLGSGLTPYSQNQTLAFKDLDGDGLKDLVLPGDSYTAHYRNLGNFQFQYISAVTSSCGRVNIADFNNDGNNDIITSGYGYFYINLNDGSGVFSLSNEVMYGVSNGSSSFTDFAVYDYDQDGDNDVVYLNNGSVKTVKLYLNNGTGGFGTPTTLYTTSSNISNLFATNIDGDNIPDLVFLSLVGTNYTLYFKASSSGSFQNSGLTIHEGNGMLFNVLDVNGDNLSELFSVKTNTANYLQEFVTYSYSPPSNFVLSNVIDDFYIYGNPNFLQIGDLNNDGKDDVLGYPSARIYSDTGEMIPAITYLPSQLANEYKLADLNQDNFLDIVGNQSDGLVYRLNNGNGSFGNTVLISSTTMSYNGMRKFDIKDGDGDGDMDLYSTKGAPSFLVYKFNNNGNMNFGTGVLEYTDMTSGLNLSTANNIILSKDSSSSPNDVKLAILSNNQTKITCSFFGSFAAYLVYENAISNSLSEIQLMDVDEDGLNDVVFVMSELLVWSRNQGDLTFAPPSSFNTNGNVGNMLLVDHDNDGDLDIAVTNNNCNTSRVGIIENLSFGNFSNENTIIDNICFEGTIKLMVGDYQGDGDQDLFINESSRDKTSVLRNVLNNTSEISGKVFMDLNQNQVLDNNDFGISNIQINSIGSGSIYANTNVLGDFNLNVFTGNHIISPNINTNWSLTTDSSIYHVNVSALGQQFNSLNFGVFPLQFYDSALVNLTGGFPRCNSIVNHWINTKNSGTNLQSGIVSLKMDTTTTFVYSFPIPDSISNGYCYWHYDNLHVNDFNRINVQLQFPPFTSMGNDITSIATSYIFDQNGIITDTIADTLSQVLVCGYDPNDKVNFPIGIGEPGFITNDQEWIKYTIRFQNTGNDTVFNVRIIDQIAPNLDISTFELLGSSSTVTINYLPTSKIEFNFNNILLPDSSINFLGSQGFVVFKIKKNPNLSHGSEIKNKASIFFDLNPPVITNTVLNTIYECPNNYTVSYIENICNLSNLQANVNVYSNLDNYFWYLDSVEIENASIVNWISDTSGIFNLTLSVLNPLCPQYDTLFPMLIYPTYNFVSDTISICQGDSTFIHGNYENESNVYWEYLNTISGCDSIVGLALNVNIPPIIVLDEYMFDTVCLQSNNMELPIGYPLGGVYSGTGLVGNEFIPSIAGLGTFVTYYQFVDSNNCISVDSSFVFVENCLGISEMNTNRFSVYPNPTKGQISIEQNENSSYSFCIFDVFGQIHYQNPTISQNIYNIDLTELSRGIYYFEIIDKDSNEKIVYKIILE